VSAARNVFPGMTRAGLRLLAAGCLLAGCGSAPLAPATVAVHGADDVRAALAGGRVTRTLVFDGGQLELQAPGATRPDPDEARAIALVRSNTSVGSASLVGLALVGLARASLTSGVTFPPAVTASPPHVANRLVWMILTTGGPHSCTPMTGPATPQPEPLHLDLVAADGSGLGITYTTAGSFCGRLQPAAAAPLIYHLSLPWRIVSSDARTITVAADLPPCALAQGGTSSANLKKGTSTLGIDAAVFMTPDGCHVDGPGSGSGSGSGRSATESISRTGTGLPSPDPTGLNLAGMITYPSLKDFTYDDGATHTIP